MTHQILRHLSLQRFSNRLLLLAVLALLWGTLPIGHTPTAQAAQQQTTSRISGHVYDEQTGVPVAGARIALDVPALSTMSDTAGRFVLADIPAAAPYRVVTIRVQAEGYGTWTMRDTLLYPGITRLLTIGLSASDTTIQAGLPRAVTGERQEPDTTPPPADSPALQDAFQTGLPATIRVARTGYKLCDDWVAAGRPVQRVDTVDFKEYVKNVLPNEWLANWHPDALRAGAMAVKQFAWYKILTQVRAPYGADIVDNTCDQYYVPASQHARTSAAVDATWDYVMYKGGALFPLHYLNSRARCDTTSLQPCMPQEGTQEDAQAGMDWQEILDYYYAPDEIVRLGEPETYSYEYVGQEPATTDTPFHLEEPRTLELRIRNTGSATWYREGETGCRVSLGTGEVEGGGDPLRAREHASPFYAPGAAGWLNERRVSMVEEAVAPGEIATFRFTAALAGGIVGEVREYWSPIAEGAGCALPQWMPGSGMQFWLFVFPFSYSVVDHSPSDGAPHTRPTEFVLRLRNEGAATWYHAVDTPGNSTGYAVHLATGNPTDETDNPYAQPDHPSPFYVADGTGWWQGTSDRNRIVMAEEAVPPGEVATFRFSAGVLPTAAVIDAAFTPLVEHLGWMEHQEGSSLLVANNPYHAAASPDNDPAHSPMVLAPGEVGMCRVALINNGYAAWEQQHTYLGTVAPEDDVTHETADPAAFAHASWLRSDRPARLQEHRVAPGEVGRFIFVVQAPETPGSYRLRLRPLVEQDAVWEMTTGETDPACAIDVTAPPPDRARFAIAPAYTRATPTQPFSLTIMASIPLSEADAVAAYLTFDPTLLEVVDAAGNPTSTVQLNPTLFPTSTLHAADNQQGTISIQAARQETPYLRGTFPLATVYMRARVADRPAEISFSSQPERRNEMLRAGNSLDVADYHGRGVILIAPATSRTLYLPLIQQP